MAQSWKLDWHGERWDDRLADALGEGLGIGAEHLLGVSRQVVPLEEGTLSRSGVAVVDRASLQAAVSYGTPYAVMVHEALDHRHDPGRQAKYLESPAKTQAGTIRDLIAARLRRELP